MKMFQKLGCASVFLSVLLMQGCVPALVGGGAAAGYYVGKDERSAKEILDDATITGAVKAKFIRDPEVSALDINVDTRSGVVTLYGSVSSASMEQRAIDLVQGVRGVKKIVSKLTIVSHQ